MYFNYQRSAFTITNLADSHALTECPTGFMRDLFSSNISVAQRECFIDRENFPGKFRQVGNSCTNNTAFQPFVIGTFQISII